MILWVIFGLLLVASLLFLVGPLWIHGRRSAVRADYDLEVYRQQLDEVGAEEARGALTAEEAEAARTAIKRRMLRAGGEAAEPAAGPSGRPLVTALVLSIVVPVAAFGLYFWAGGRPGLPDQPLAERQDAIKQVAAARKEQQEVAQLAMKLRTRLQNNPGDVRGWLMLGRTYQTMQRFDDAADAYRAAASASPEDPNIWLSLGEAMTFAAQGTVTPKARTVFEKVQKLDPKNPGAQFYLGLERAQAEDWQAAYDRWLALAKVTPAGAPWRSVLLERLAFVAKRLGVDLAAELPPAPAAAPQPAPGPGRADIEAAQGMSTKDQNELIRSMVDGLAARLADSPNDFKGWMRLGRAYRVLGDANKSLDAYNRAVGLQPDDVEALLNQAGALIEVDGADGNLPSKAVEIYRRVLTIDPKNADALWFSGRAAVEAGDKAAARDLWSRLLANFKPGSQEYVAVKSQLDSLTATD